MTKLPRAMIVFLITLTSVGCDQASKLAAKQHLQHGPVYSYAGDTFRLQYAENTGAFLNLGASLPNPDYSCYQENERQSVDRGGTPKE